MNVTNGSTPKRITRSELAEAHKALVEKLPRPYPLAKDGRLEAIVFGLDGAEKALASYSRIARAYVEQEREETERMLVDLVRRDPEALARIQAAVKEKR